MATPVTNDSQSPAAKVMDEALDLAIEGRSPYPEKAAFIDADEPGAGHAIERAADQGLSVVLVSADGSTPIALAELGSRKDLAVMVGDSIPKDIDGALAAGLKRGVGQSQRKLRRDAS